MAGNWIKMRNDLAEDPAVIAIAAKVGIDEFAVVGRLHALWAWADEQSRDGHATGVTSSWLDRKVQCPGFADAMGASGWLEVTKSGLAIPNFDAHNGESAKTRALGSRRKQSERAKKAVTPSVAPVSRAQRDENATREEKSRGVEPPVSPLGTGTAAEPKRKAASRRNRKVEGITFDEWVDGCKAKGEDRIPENDPVREFARDAGIPEDFLRVAWAKFRDRYHGKPERYLDWRQHFGNAVRDNWFKLWWVDGQGQYTLTTVGQQLRRAIETRRKDGTHDA